MRKFINILCAAAALVAGLAGCQEKAQEELSTAEVRYRAESVYNLDAVNAKAFTIMVASSEPWTVTSAHPDWCIISEEDGAASDPETLHVGKAEPTVIRVQYYDNTFLDDRTDKIYIESNGFRAKTITVNQKGIAFLTIPEEDMAFEVEKAGGDVTIHINSNQPWSSRVTEGEWISIAEGSSGEGVGTVTVNAQENVTELRYAQVTIYDRHDKAAMLVQFTQDGVQLVPATLELRASYDQTTAQIDVASNTKWIATKSDGADWFTLTNASGDGDGAILISLNQNDEAGIRSAQITLKNVVANPDDYAAEKTIVLKQAYRIEPVRVMMTADEMAEWNSDWANTPVYVKNEGLSFTAKARLNRSMEFGTYTFHWSNLVSDPENGGPRVRHWFCFSEGAELKADIRPSDAKVSFDFNAAGDGNKPSLNSFTDVDFTQPVEFTYKFDLNGKTGTFGDSDVEYCHVTYYVNGVEAGSFDTSPELMRSVYFGAKINMYIGVDTAGSATLEWYEYTAPMKWDD